MAVRIIGTPPFADDRGTCPECRIATVFPTENAVITLPGIHATQRLDFLDLLSKERAEAGREMLTREEAEKLSLTAVDLVWEEDLLLIRPDVDHMEAALAADDLLQQIVPKCRIRFLHTRDDRVWAALKRRGECWRTAPKPTSTADMQRLVTTSRKAIGCGAIYYYSRATGSHLLTYHEFARLDALGDGDLRDQLLEIARYAEAKNRLGHREVVFFGAEHEPEIEVPEKDLASMPAPRLRRYYRGLRDGFHGNVGPEVRRDDPEDLGWLTRFYRSLTELPEAPAPEEVRLELSSEFHMHIEWLPGGRFEEGRLLWDPVLKTPPSGPATVECDTRVKDFLLNLHREHADLEYVNVGRVVEPLSNRPPIGERRGMYVAEIMRQGASREEVKIIRLQKWDMHERLDNRKDLLQAMRESDEYTEYILDRWVGCRQLGMHLPAGLSASRVVETYEGSEHRYRDTRVWVDYFVRDYIWGTATTTLAAPRFGDA